ncbi:MAG: FUSC family protein [Brachymonas sp.]|nr:FUSC family protein [Brachymonas sp.]
MDEVVALLKGEFRHLVTFQPAQRPWQMPVAAALAAGLPLLVGAWFDRMDYGLIASLGGQTFLYTSNTHVPQRMVTLMVCAFGMAACFALALIGSFHPASTIVVLTVLSTLVTMVCRFYRLQPPGSLFFIMAASIAAYMPWNFWLIPLRVGLIFMGSTLAVLIAFFYSLHIVRRQKPVAHPPIQNPGFQFVVYDSVMIGAFVGLSLVLAHVLRLQSPYWVPVSCIAIMQNMTMRAVWNRQVHRILGTAAGVVLAWGLLLLPFNKWGLCITIMVLTFMIEMLVVRNYALAVMFITPLTIYLAKSGAAADMTATALILTRLVDIVLGSVIGCLGGVFLHDLRLRSWLSERVFRVPFPSA